LRNSIRSNDTVFFRTEINHTLWIDNQPTNEMRKDFTYEFAGNKHWPTPSLFDRWCDLVYNSFPLYIDAPREMIGMPYHTKNFYDRTNRKVMMQVTKEKYPSNGITITLQRPVKDVYSLLFFMHPDYYCAKTRDGSIELVNNTVEPSGKTLFIPDHYV